MKKKNKKIKVNFDETSTVIEPIKKPICCPFCGAVVELYVLVYVPVKEGK